MNWSQIVFNGSVVLTLTIFMLVILCIDTTEGCNEAVCASIVSKCMLTQSCKCDLKNCTCCKECSICLSEFYSECCSCVEMCPKSNDTNYHMLSTNSHVEDLNENSVEGLFNALTEEPDPENRWIVYNYPNDFGNFDSIFSPKHEEPYLQSIDSKNPQLPNCTVAFLTQCMGWNKCRQNCLSMGASSYRWFHDGCCECVGKTCINYGIKESRCPACNTVEDVSSLEDQLDYGEFDYESQSLGDM